MKRLLDIFLALAATLMLALPIVLIAILVRLTSPGPALYWSDRVGRHNRIFRMPKFRTMRVGTPAVYVDRVVACAPVPVRWTG